MPPGFPDALRRAAKRFLNEYSSQMRPFEAEYEVVPGVLGGQQRGGLKFQPRTLFPLGDITGRVGLWDLADTDLGVATVR
jgi:hypothetical protein